MAEWAPKAVVCDDEPNTVRLLQVLLERRGFDVFTAFDGHSGLKKIREVNPDLVILDVLMPGMNGLEVLNGLRQDPATAKVVVIVLSALSRNEDVVAAYEMGADMYLSKPFNPAELF